MHLEGAPNIEGMYHMNERINEIGWETSSTTPWMVKAMSMVAFEGYYLQRPTTGVSPSCIVFSPNARNYEVKMMGVNLRKTIFS